MDLEKVAQLVKTARQSKSEEQRIARQNYRLGGQQMRRTRKLKQRARRRKGGLGLKNKVAIQTRRLEYRPIRIRKEPLQNRPRDRS